MKVEMKVSTKIEINNDLYGICKKTLLEENKKIWEELLVTIVNEELLLNNYEYDSKPKVTSKEGCWYIEAITNFNIPDWVENIVKIGGFVYETYQLSEVIKKIKQKIKKQLNKIKKKFKEQSNKKAKEILDKKHKQIYQSAIEQIIVIETFSIEINPIIKIIEITLK